MRILHLLSATISRVAAPVILKCDKKKQIASDSHLESIKTINETHPMTMLRTILAIASLFAGGAYAQTAPATRFVNISTRASTVPDLDGSNAVIAGFVVSGTEPKQVLLRVAGASLKAFGLQETVKKPVMTLYKMNGGTTQIASVAGAWDGGRAELTDTAPYYKWITTPEEIYNAMVATGAFLFPGWRPGQEFRNPLRTANPYGSNESDLALLITLEPGIYTAVTQELGASDPSAARRAMLIEVYEVGAQSRLVNISTRGNVQTGDNVMIGGFVVSGDASKRVLIRGIGPGLASRGVISPLVTPQVVIYNKGEPIHSFGAISDLAAADREEILTVGTAVGAFAPENSDAARVLSLPPGIYTAVVRGKDDTTGNALLEIYEVP